MPKSELGLFPVGVECWGGFFFLNLSPAEAAAHRYDLSAQLGPVPNRVQRYPLAELRSAHRISYDVVANWSRRTE